MTQTRDVRAEYEALGIKPDVWTCVATLTKSEAKSYVWILAQSDVPAKVARGPEGKYHVAVLGGLIDNPAAYFATIREDPINPLTCATETGNQHPLDG